MLYQIILKKNSWKDFVQLRAVIEIGTLNVILENDPDEEKIRNLYEIQEKMEAALQGHKKRRGFPLCRASQGDSGSNLKKGKGQDCPDCN